MPEANENQRKHVLISMNPKSGAKDQRNLVESLHQQLVEFGFEAQILTDIDQINATVDRLQTEPGSELRCVVAAGGDGTVSLLANRLPQGTPLSIFPLGTENLLAKHFRLVADPLSHAKIIRDGCVRKMDAGLANGKLFLVVASCGFDAEVVHELDAVRTGHISRMTWIKPILTSLGRYKYPKLRISIDDAEPIEVTWAFMFNVPRYAMGIPFVPDADESDGELDLLTFRGGKTVRGVFYLGSILFRMHRKLNLAQHTRFRKLRIEADTQVHFQLDGDPGGELPLDIEIVPERLALILPGS